jgi:putative glutamine amidotransferase
MVIIYQLSATMKTSGRCPYMLILCIGITMFLMACSARDNTDPILIGISKGKPDQYYGAYTEWLKAADSTVMVVDLYHLTLDSALRVLDDCSGLLLTGGPDIHPGFYGRPQDTVLCDDGIDGKRDTLELMLIGKALESDIPVLGICRGLQVLNVALGGSLYADIPSHVNHHLPHRCADKDTCFHEISVEEGSSLHLLSQQSEGRVNSNHHQGISMLADNLSAVARAPDGIIEAIQWEYADNKAYFLAVQWHPERMEYENPFSLPLAKSFILAAYYAKQLKSRAGQ